MSFENGNNMYMPVVPASYGYGGGNGYGIGGDGGFLWLILFFALFGGGMWGGNNMNGGMYPWLNQSNQINDGFQNQMLNTSVQGVQNAVTNGFSSAEVAACGRAMNDLQTQYQNQIADLERSYNAQTAISQGFNAMQAQLAQCCCDNRLATCQTQNIVQNEGAATRLAIQNQTQTVLDKMCQDTINAKNDRIVELTNRVNYLEENNYVQNAITAQTQYLLSILAPRTATTAPATVSAG